MHVESFKYTEVQYMVLSREYLLLSSNIVWTHLFFILTVLYVFFTGGFFSSCYPSVEFFPTGMVSIV